jgi:hypothetical protein
MYSITQDMANLPPFKLKSRKPLWKEEFLMQPFSKSDYWKAAWQEVDIFNKNLFEDPTKQIPGFDLPRKIWCKLNRLEPAMANAIICCFTETFVKTLLVNAVQKKKPSNTLWKNVPLLNSSKVSPNYI